MASEADPNTFRALLRKYRLDDHSWVADPRKAAPQLIEARAEVGALYAEAELELWQTQTNYYAWKATKAAEVLAHPKRRKWPQWKVEVEVESDPKYRVHRQAVGAALDQKALYENLLDALRRKAWYLGVFYDVKFETYSAPGAVQNRRES